MTREEVLEIIEYAAKDGRKMLYIGENQLTSLPADLASSD